MMFSLWQIICLDLSEEMSLPKLESFNGWVTVVYIHIVHLFVMFHYITFLCRSKTNALNISQKMIEMFVRTKHKIDKRHEFALVVVNDDALWVSSGGECSNFSMFHRLLASWCWLSISAFAIYCPFSFFIWSCQVSHLIPGSCAVVSMIWKPTCVNPSVSFT